MKASVIVPMYNAKAYIGKTIESILPQLDSDMELLIIDDGSTDGSTQIADSYACGNVHRISIPNSGGPARPRNEGIRQAKGEILFIFDADDLMLPGKIADTLAAFAQHPDAAMVFTDFQSIDGNDKLLNPDYLGKYDVMKKYRNTDGKAALVPRADAYRSLAFENYIGTSSVAIRKGILSEIGDFDASLKNSDDRDMWFRITRQHDVAYLPRVLHAYRVHGQSISHRSTHARVDSKVSVLKKQLPFSPDAGFRNQILGLCADNYFSLAWEHAKQGQTNEGFRYLVQSMQHQFRVSQLKLLAKLLLQKVGLKAR